MTLSDSVPVKCKCGTEPKVKWEPGVHDIFVCVMQCPRCGRRTGPYLEAQNAVEAWNRNFPK